MSDLGGSSPRSSELQPGTRLRHIHGHIVTLDRRKRPDDAASMVIPYSPGWWLRDGDGGLADFVIDDPESDWEVDV